MKWKKGQRVFIKPLELMKKQYATTELGQVVRDDGIFTARTEDKLKGTDRIVTIAKVSPRNYQVDRLPDYLITDEMIAGEAFDYGEKVLVSDGDFWAEVIFVGFIAEAEFPYMGVNRNEEDGYLQGKAFGIEAWKKAKKIHPETLEITIKRNGKEISPDTLSKETWENLRTAK